MYIYKEAAFQGATAVRSGIIGTDFQGPAAVRTCRNLYGSSFFKKQ